MTGNNDTAGNHQMSNTDLAFERTVLAENRTLMAWVRTAISLISFGFTIYKFFHEAVETNSRLLTPRIVGMVMIIFGLLSLVWGLMDHKLIMKKLKQNYLGVTRSKTTILALMILLFGLVLFLAALFRQ